MAVDSTRDLLVKVGFDVEGDSSLLAYAADDHTEGIGRRIVERNV